MRVRMKVEVRGIVQGVGFRPFIHRLVSGYGFLGWVRNSSRGVDMELEGEESELREFASRIAPEAPLLADVESVECAVMPDDTPESLAERIHGLEHKWFPTIIENEIEKLAAAE